MSTQQSRNIFTEELCKYFMDFLQSGFKSTRFPKRYIRLKDEKNFKLGKDYPFPLVIHAAAREKALRAFKKI